MKTAFLRTVRLSIGEESRPLFVTDVAMEARNIRNGDEALIMSKMETDLWLCQMVAVEYWLYQR